MAGTSTPTPSAAGGRKSVDFQLNLVPMIDLLSVLIVFLLTTAVLTQFWKIDVRQSPVDQGESEQRTVLDQLELTVSITGSGYTITEHGSAVKVIEKKGDAYDTAVLAGALAERRALHPDNKNVQIVSDDKIPYRELITVMDLCLEQKLTGISVGGADG